MENKTFLYLILLLAIILKNENFCAATTSIKVDGYVYCTNCGSLSQSGIFNAKVNLVCPGDSHSSFTNSRGYFDIFELVKTGTDIGSCRVSVDPSRAPRGCSFLTDINGGSSGQSLSTCTNNGNNKFTCGPYYFTPNACSPPPPPSSPPPPPPRKPPPPPPRRPPPPPTTTPPPPPPRTPPPPPPKTPPPPPPRTPPPPPPRTPPPPPPRTPPPPPPRTPPPPPPRTPPPPLSSLLSVGLNSRGRVSRERSSQESYGFQLPFMRV
ncbi:sulfated surface glycoprotein 185 [Selaginella moellendorffii]|uniref:sulfated surface glycoprotein 185 n=1 Tax=Selaginella moellendorffii TaxID=88036 RepID=UPI000D1C3F42|nr:sulfated surface glycoprotein 185 [Selaginella moellendorffii]|eukprot:XP_002964164.2 sulfated surface glycoprotein 185 [Selaginella moellendorffii]